MKREIIIIAWVASIAMVAFASFGLKNQEVAMVSMLANVGLSLALYRVGGKE